MIRRWRRFFALFMGAYLLACVSVAIASSAVGTSPQLIVGDAIGYYSWLRSPAIDGDIDFANDYQLLYPPDPLPDEASRVTVAGLVPNKYPPALAIVELPGLAAGHLAALVTGAQTDGASAPYQVAVTVWVQLVIAAGFIGLWLALGRIGADPAMSTLLIASGLVATNLVNYAAKDATMAHGTGAALLCFALYVLVRAQQSERPVRWLAAAGSLFGLAVAIRPTNAAFVAFLLPWLWPSVRGSARNALAVALPIVLMMLFHLALTSMLFGRLTLTGYEGESFTGGARGLIGTLFSSRHGLLVYTPWYLLMIVLCAAATRAQSTRGLAWGALESFALLWIANGTWWSWWFGSGFGNRAFIESIPALIVPAALWLSQRATPRTLVTLSAGMAVLTALNLYLWLGYLLRRYPADGLHTIAEAYLWFR